MTNQTKTNQNTVRKTAGYAYTTKNCAVHITAQVAGEERHYIIPAQDFDRFVTGHNVTGINRDELNAGNGEEAYTTARCIWECGVAYLYDTLNDPLQEYRVRFPVEGLADLFSFTRAIIFLSGREQVRYSSRRVEEEIGRQIRRETFEGYVYPYINAAEV